MYQAPHSSGSMVASAPNQNDQPSAPAGTGGTQGAPPAAPETPLTPEFSNPGVGSLQGSIGGGVGQPTFQTPMPPGGFHPASSGIPASAPWTWSVLAGLQDSSPPQPPSGGGYDPAIGEFTDSGTGCNFPVMDGEVAVVFSVPPNDPRVQEFIKETRTVWGGSLPFIRAVTLLLPPDTSVEYAVEHWPQQYPDIIESVWAIPIAYLG